MKKIFSFFILFNAFCSLAQNAKEEDMSAAVHLEFSAKLGGGISTPLFNYRDKGGYTLKVKNRWGQFGCGSAQTAICIENNFAIVIEAGYAVSSNPLDYYWAQYTSPVGGFNDWGDYKLNIRKTEFSVIARHLVGAKRRLTISYGGYFALEDSKIIDGNVIATASFNPPSQYPSYYYHGTDVYNKKHMKVSEQPGVILGTGYNFPLKNKNIISLDFRLNGHLLYSEINKVSFRMFDVGLSIGYTFFKTKSITINRYQTPPAN
jgi:hypothetical protein